MTTNPLIALFNRFFRPYPFELSESIWLQEEARAERITNLVRVAFLMVWIVATTTLFPVTGPVTRWVNSCAGFTWIAWAIFFHARLMRKPYMPILKYISITIDIVLVTLILFFYQFEAPLHMVNTLKTPGFMNYFLILALAAFRMNAALPIYGLMLTAICYLGLLAYGVLLHKVELGTPAEMLSTAKISLSFQFINIVYLATFTILTVVLVRNIRRLVGLHVEEAERVVKETHHRQKALEVLERYFTPSIARHLLEHPRELGGKVQRVTVMVCDVRRFTTLSEKVGPATSVDILNKLFDALVEIVFEHHGTLDKFLGDGMLVVFGIPEPCAGDAMQALRAAVRIIHKTAELAAQLREPLEIGAAIHTGDVLLGNIGSSKRMEFTVIGDTVNTACRMEEMNKEFGTKILISETTLRECNGAILVRSLPSTALRGKAKPMPLYVFEGFLPQ